MGFMYNIQTVLCRVIFRDIVYPVYCVKNEVLHRDEEERNALHRVKRRKVKLIGHILRRDCLGKRD